jgi:hypothetical protein
MAHFISHDVLVFAGIAVLYVLLTHFILPKAGVPT